MFAAVTLAAIGLTIGSSYIRYFQDQYLEELRIDCDVPGTAVYADGKLLGTVPVRIFSGELIEGRDWRATTHSVWNTSGGRGVYFQTPKHSFLIEFDPPRIRPKGVVSYSTDHGDRAFVRPAKDCLTDGPLKSVLRIDLIATRPELWVDCDVAGAIIYGDGKVCGESPILLGDISNFQIPKGKDGKVTLSPTTDGKGIEVRTLDSVLRLECLVPTESAKNHDCYQKDARMWLKDLQFESTSQPSGKVTVHLHAKRR